MLVLPSRFDLIPLSYPHAVISVCHFSSALEANQAAILILYFRSGQTTFPMDQLDTVF